MASSDASPPPQPALLERLRGDATQGELSARALRNDVVRNLTDLLGATSLAAVQDLSAWPAVASSVLNFGINVPAGQAAAGTNPRGVAQAVRKAILDFEPRIVARSLRVEVRSMTAEEAAERGMGGQGVVVEIVGDMWTPYGVERLELRGGLDTEHGALSAM